MKYIYKALVDFPAFNIITGMIYTDEQMTTKQKSLKDVPTVFEKIRDTSDELHVGDMVIASGRLANVSSPKRNKFGIHNTNILGEEVNNMVAEILEIIENAHGTGMWGVKLRGDNGDIYWAYTKTLDRMDHLNPFTSHYNTRLIPGKVYFYISSGGCICRTVLGKDKRADEFRNKIGNCFETHDAAYAAYCVMLDS